MLEAQGSFDTGSCDSLDAGFRCSFCREFSVEAVLVVFGGVEFVICRECLEASRHGVN